MFAITTKTTRLSQTGRTWSLIPKTISPLTPLPTKARGLLQSRRGFTIIEILVVIAIIGLIVSLGLPAIQNVTNQRVHSSTRRFIGLFRSIRNDAILLNLIHRIAINLDDQTYWIENQKKLSLLEEGPSDGTTDPNFVYTTKYTKEPKKMPPGVVFSGVKTEQYGLVKTGIAYVHFFPNGIMEQSTLYISKEGADVVFYSVILRHGAGVIDLVPGAAQ